MDPHSSPSIPKKLCKACNQMFPATKEFFVTGKGHKDGLRYLCKECRNKARRKTLPHALHSKYVPVPEGCRRCSRCKQNLPATSEFFTARAKAKSGLNEY